MVNIMKNNYEIQGESTIVFINRPNGGILEIISRGKN